MPYDIPFYNDIIRDKVLADVKKDPRWYLGILGKRVMRLLTDGTPIRLSWQTGWYDFKLTGIWFVSLVALALLARARFLAKALLFTLPTCAAPLIVYSGRGMSYYGIFHLVMAAMVGVLVVGNAQHLYAVWRSRGRHTSAKHADA